MLRVALILQYSFIGFEENFSHAPHCMDYPFEEGALEIHRTSQFCPLDEINKLTRLGFSGQSDY